MASERGNRLGLKFSGALLVSGLALGACSSGHAEAAHTPAPELMTPQAPAATTANIPPSPSATPSKTKASPSPSHTPPRPSRAPLTKDERMYNFASTTVSVVRSLGCLMNTSEAHTVAQGRDAHTTGRPQVTAESNGTAHTMTYAVGDNTWVKFKGDGVAFGDRLSPADLPQISNIRPLVVHAAGEQLAVYDDGTIRDDRNALASDQTVALVDQALLEAVADADGSYGRHCPIV